MFASDKTMQFETATAKRWRIIQIAALFPIILCVFSIFYFQEASGLGLICLFLFLIFGILLPETKADIVRSHLMLRAEQEELRRELQKLQGGPQKAAMEQAAS